MAAWASFMAACSPLVRYGDIEPPKDRQALVEVRITPVDRKPPPGDVLSASGQQAFREQLLEPMAKVDAGTVASEMAADVQSLDASATKAAVDMAELGTDARRVESMYAARGYFRARTLPFEVVSRGNRTARLELRVREGPVTVVSEVVFAGITPSDDDAAMNARLEEIRRELPDLVLLSKGDVWDEDLYLRSLDLVQRAFRERGFIHATVTGDNWVSREKHEAAVWFAIEHGPLVRSEGEPIIVGQHHIPKRRIRARVGIEDGDILEAKLLRETELDVSDLGAFFSVQVRAQRVNAKGEVLPPDAPTPVMPAPGALSPAPPPANAPAPTQPVVPPLGPAAPTVAPDDDDEVLDSEPVDILPPRVPVEVQLQEASEWDLSIGPAAVADSNKFELALPMSFTHRNLFDQVIALRASAKPALVFPDFFNGDRKSDWGLLARLGLSVPTFIEEFLRFDIEATFERDVTQATKKQELGGRAGLSRRFGGGLSGRIGYNVSQVRYFKDGALKNVSPALVLDLADFRYDKSDFVTWLGLTTVYDARDSIFDARHGAYGSLSLDYGDGWTGSDVTFVRGSLEARGYITLDAVPWLTVGLRTKIGATWFPQGQGTPESIRFKSGGPTSNRGFSTNQMGDYLCADNKQHPHDPIASANDPTCPDAATDRVYIGGNYVFENNVELRFQPGSFGFVVFMDIGRLWSRYQDIDLSKLFVTVGPGLRIATPVGPLRFDLGLLLGKHRDRVFNFTLGQAF
ncbi:MAG: sorting and assembly machinery component 50 [Myxococcota bacterium]